MDGGRERRGAADYCILDADMRGQDAGERDAAVNSGGSKKYRREWYPKRRRNEALQLGPPYPCYSGGIGSGEGVFCGRIQLCWIRRATMTPCRMVVREKDGLRAAEWSESLSCSSTKSATIPGDGVSDSGGELLWKPPIARRELSVTAS